MCRYRNKPIAVFAPKVESIIKWSTISLTFPIICFGPIIGVIAAGCIFGAASNSSGWTADCLVRNAD